MIKYEKEDIKVGDIVIEIGDIGCFIQRKFSNEHSTEDLIFKVERIEKDDDGYEHAYYKDSIYFNEIDDLMTLKQVKEFFNQLEM